LTFTVPAGWATSADSPNVFTLTPGGDYSSETKDGPAPGTIHEIDVFAVPQRAIQDPNCDFMPDTKAGHSVSDLVAYLKHEPALAVSELASATVGGYPARVLDLRLDPKWTGQCPDIGIAFTYLGGTFGSTPGSSWYSLAIATGERQRLMLVDLGQGDVVAIVIDSSSSARFSSLVDAAQQIIQSIEFK
jgi:hypothetical protein